MNYEEMSDKEINREVASYFYDENWLSRHAEMLGMIPDYCNDPSDAWSIIVENLIDIEWVSKSHCVAVHYLNDGELISSGMQKKKDSLRAAMICFLKMKEV